MSVEETKAAREEREKEEGDTGGTSEDEPSVIGNAVKGAAAGAALGAAAGAAQHVISSRRSESADEEDEGGEDE